MVIVMQEGATDEQIQHVIDRIVSSGFDVHRSTGASHTVLGAVGVHRDFDHRDFELLEGVREVVRITQPFKLASRQFKPHGTIVDLGRGVTIGGNGNRRRRGPLLRRVARADPLSRGIRRQGRREDFARWRVQAAHFALRVSGPGRKRACRLIRDAADKFKLFVVSEVMDPSQIQMMSDYVDIFQVGARNMQNYFLLRALGEVHKAGPAETRNVRHHRGTSAERRIYSWRRKFQRNSVRAGHPHV